MMRVKLDQRDQALQRAIRVPEQQAARSAGRSSPAGSVTATLTRLQQTHGNRFVRGMLSSTTLGSGCQCQPSGAVAEEEKAAASLSETLASSRKLPAPERIDSLPAAPGVPESTLGDRPAARTASLQPTTETLFATDEGTETVNTATPDAGTAGGGGCSVTGSFSSIPSGTLAATLSGSKLGASFSMVGDFTPSIPCTCSCGEYRQYVRGEFTRNGSAVTHALCGTNLHKTSFQEDCGIFGGTTYKYGYRSIPFANSRFAPDQATGCTFNGFDSPGISGSSGDRLGVSLDFRGDLIDTCNANAVLATSSWSVSGSATVA